MTTKNATDGMVFPCYVVYTCKSPTRADVYVGCVKCKTAKKWENYRTSSGDWKNQTDAVLTPFVVMPGTRDDYPEQHAWKFERQLWLHLKSRGFAVQKQTPAGFSNLDTMAHPLHDPEVAASVGAKNSEHMTRYYKETPGAREKASERNKRRYEDQAEREKTGAATKRYYDEVPSAREKASAAQTHRYENPAEREKASTSAKSSEKVKANLSVVLKRDKTCSCGLVCGAGNLARHIKSQHRKSNFDHYRDITMFEWEVAVDFGAK